MGRNMIYVSWGVFLLFLTGIGLFAGRFEVYLGMRIMILAIFALGYNVLFGRTGLLSFGHAAFYAAGGYGLALCYMHLTTHPLLCILVGVASAALLALIIGFFCVRHTEIYFAMLTLAFGMMFFSLVWNLREITGGDDGLVGIGREPLDLGVFSLPLGRASQFFFLVLFFFVLSAWVIHRIRSSPFGLVLAGIKENDTRTEFAGVAVKNYRLAAFIVSAVFAGLAGALGTLLESNIDPLSAHWTYSAEPVLVSLIGGINTFFGPVAGSFIFIAFREVIERFTQNWMLWFGIILLVIIMGFRGGVVGAISMLWSRTKVQKVESGGER